MDWLPIAEYAYNDKEHSAMKQTPFYLNYGFHPWKGELQISTGNNQALENFVECLTAACAAAEKSFIATQEKTKGFFDKHRVESCQYKEGDLVWLESTNITSTHPSKKLGEK